MTTSLCHVQGVDKILEKIRNLEIEFLCVGYIEITSTGSTECSSVRLKSVELV
jgi:hypothetical protein